MIILRVIKVNVLRDPLDGVLEALLERGLGLPAKQFSGAGVVGQQALDFGFLGAQAGFVGYQTDGFADEGDDLLG